MNRQRWMAALAALVAAPAALAQAGDPVTLYGRVYVTGESVEAKGGAIVNVGTVLVEQPIGSIPCAAAMCSKGGVHAFTRSLAVELAPHRVRVSCVAPGIVRTPLIGDAADSLAKIHPLGRVGEVSEISDAVLYLARAAFVTGVVLDVDGGYAHGR